MLIMGFSPATLGETPTTHRDQDFLLPRSAQATRMAERRIRTLQDMAQTMLIHAHYCWPKAVNTHLWPYAIRYRNDALNATPNMQHLEERIPENVLTNTHTVVANPKHWHHFGAPMYVLARPLQAAENIIHKWKGRSTIGLYLGRSPQHARKVALVLNLKTGHVSPQYHVKIDSTSQTLKDIGNLMPLIFWQIKSGYELDKRRKPKTNPNHLSRGRNAKYPT
jgi:hypothetical protein